MLPDRAVIKAAIDGVLFTNFPATKKSRLQKSKVKTLFIAFYDNKGISYKEFLPAGQTVKDALYEAV